MSSSAQTSEQSGDGVAREHHAQPRRDVLARTGPLLALLIPIFLVYGLATLAGYTTETVVLVIAVVALLITTGVVIMGVIRIASMPPEDDDEGHEVS